MKAIIKSLVLIATVAAAGSAFADSTDVTDINKPASEYQYPLQGGVDYNQMSPEWKETHGGDVRPELLGHNG
jgi:hypothetical protein